MFLVVVRYLTSGKNGSDATTSELKLASVLFSALAACAKRPAKKYVPWLM